MSIARIIVVHATPSVIPITADAFTRAFPEATLRHLLDSSLSDELDGDPATHARLTERLAALIDIGVESKPDAVLLTCSSYPLLAERMARATRAPVFRPDAAMFDEVKASGAVRIGVLATLGDAAHAAQYGLERAYAGAHHVFSCAVVDRGATDFAPAVVKASRELVNGGAEVVALAQYSLAPFAPLLEGALDCSVFSAPDAAARALRETMTKEAGHRLGAV